MPAVVGAISKTARLLRKVTQNAPAHRKALSFHLGLSPGKNQPDGVVPAFAEFSLSKGLSWPTCYALRKPLCSRLLFFTKSLRLNYSGGVHCIFEHNQQGSELLVSRHPNPPVREQLPRSVIGKRFRR